MVTRCRVGEVCYLFTDTTHGDLRTDQPESVLAERRVSIIDLPWTSLQQVHGSSIVTVQAAGDHDGAEADAAVTATPGLAISVRTADCAPLLLVSDGAFGVVHAGWRGLAAGVIAAAAERLADLDSPPRAAVLGPCIRARCYEFDDPARDQVAAAVGPAVLATTAWGTPALDLAAGVAAACEALDVPLDDVGTCTACSSRHWSHRAAGDVGRQGLVAWMDR